MEVCRDHLSYPPSTKKDFYDIEMGYPHPYTRIDGWWPSLQMDLGYRSVRIHRKVNTAVVNEALSRSARIVKSEYESAPSST